MWELYGIDTWEEPDLKGDETTRRVLKLAALAWQLPREGRTWSALAPEGAHGEVALLLRQVELNQRLWAWAHTKDAEQKRNQPRPILLGGEMERAEADAEREVEKAYGVAARLGIEI
jgi:hypothetical protein